MDVDGAAGLEEKDAMEILNAVAEAQAVEDAEELAAAVSVVDHIDFVARAEAQGAAWVAAREPRDEKAFVGGIAAAGLAAGGAAEGCGGKGGGGGARPAAAAAAAGGANAETPPPPAAAAPSAAPFAAAGVVSCYYMLEDKGELIALCG